MRTFASNTDAYRWLIDEAFNKGDLAAVDDVFDESYRSTDPSLPRANGRAGARQFVLRLREVFKDLHYEILNTVEQGDLVAAHYRVSGVHSAPFLEQRPTGAHVSCEGMSFNRFRNGKIVEGWIIWDAAGMLKKLRAAAGE